MAEEPKITAQQKMDFRILFEEMLEKAKSVNAFNQEEIG